MKAIMVNKKYLKILILISLAGLVLSSTLLTQHYRFKSGIVERSFCSINEYVDCDLVNQSRYSEVKGQPVSGFGVFYYLLLLIFFSLAHFSAEKKEGLVMAQFLSLGALAISLVMTYISLFKIKALCILCLGMVAVNFSVVVLIGPALSISVTQWRGVFKEYFGKASKIALHLLLVALVFGAGSFWMEKENRGAVEKRILGKIKNRSGFDPTRPPSEQPPLKLEDILEMHFKQPAVKMDPGNRPMWGKPGAPVVIVEFSDFECPYCGRAAHFLKPALADYQEDIAFYFANYPLDQSCNPNIKHKMHEHACNAAKAVVCAGQQGKFWALHDILFEHQQELEMKNLKKFAGEAGLDGSQIASCIKDPATNKIVLQDIALGKTLGVEGTPTIFVNGRKLEGWSHPEILKGVIEEELSR